MQIIPVLQRILLETLDFNEVSQKIVNEFLNQTSIQNFGYRIVVLTIYDETRGVLKRISLSKTPEAEEAQKASAVPFEKIEIPITATQNLLVQCFNEQKPKLTHYWPDLFMPALTSEQALKNQTSSGIKTSVIYPIIVNQKTIGVLIFSSISVIENISEEEKELLSGFTDVVGIALQNSSLFTSLKLTTENLRQANEKLKDLDQIKDEFISIASHDLRSPMATVKNYIWMARSELEKTPEKAKEDLDIALESTEHGISLVADMLDVSRIEAGRIELNPEKLDIKHEITLVIEELQKQASDKNINLGSEVSDGLFVMADKERFHQILTNLTGNALKFTPSGGKVTILGAEKEKMVEISVTDTGIGIKKEDIDKLFTKFGKLENSTNLPTTAGTGLGLYISKNIVELSGGKIRAESTLGKGSKFIFTLPSI
jgi:signal transduction histidine kinase